MQTGAAMTGSHRSSSRRSLLTLWVGIACLLLALPLAAQTGGSYQILPEASEVAFSINKFGVGRQHGVFRDFSGVIHYQPEDLDVAGVEFTVQVASIDTGNRGRDRRVQEDDFFHSDRYPAIRFVSTRVRQQEPGIFEVEGNLTIRDITRRITLPVRLAGTDAASAGQLAFETDVVVDRTRFDVLGSRWSGGRLLLGNDVALRIRVSAAKAEHAAKH